MPHLKIRRYEVAAPGLTDGDILNALNHKCPGIPMKDIEVREVREEEGEGEDLIYIVEAQSATHKVNIGPEGVIENEGGALMFINGEGKIVAVFAPGEWTEARLKGEEEGEEHGKGDVDNPYIKTVKGTLIELYTEINSINPNNTLHHITAFSMNKQKLLDLLSRAMFELENPAFVREEAKNTSIEEGGK